MYINALNELIHGEDTGTLEKAVSPVPAPDRKKVAQKSGMTNDSSMPQQMEKAPPARKPTHPVLPWSAPRVIELPGKDFPVQVFTRPADAGQNATWKYFGKGVGIDKVVFLIDEGMHVRLNVGHTPPQGMSFLAAFKPDAIQSLGLTYGNVVDADLELIKNWNTLESLELSGAGITDNAIPILATLGSLNKLLLKSTAVSEEGKVMLEGMLPLCNIMRLP